jgi:DNA polymerase III subunit alpha
LTRQNNLKYINNYILEQRYNQIDEDFLEYEVVMISDSDLERIEDLLRDKERVSESSLHDWDKLDNPHNSILLYVTGLTDAFDFSKARSDMIDGAPPDVDIDHDALDREKAIQWCIDYWGRERVANIITHGTFKPKSLARSFYRITEGNNDDLGELLSKIPMPKYGKEANLEEILEQNPELSEEERYQSFLEFADRIEGMVANFGIHAAGVIISDKEIHDTIPIWKNSKADRITQYDKDECEELGLLKFDFLGIDTLSIIKECKKLIKENHSIDIEPYAIPDEDPLAYKYLNKGYLTGIFQMETSGVAKRLITAIKPSSIEDLSAISAINRPGPLQAGLDRTYIANKLNNSPPKDLPHNVAEILKASYWTLIYQEQIMKLFTEIAGFTSQEADDVRRAMGKKKMNVLEKYEQKFVEGAQSIGGLMETYSKSLWDDILGFADYCLASDTKIKLPLSKGLKCEYSTIEKIVEKQYNGPVFSYNQLDTKEVNFSIQSVSQWHSKGKKDVYRYTFEDGSQVTCTSDHKFLALKTLKFLPIDLIYSKNLGIMSIKNKKS